MDYAGGRSVEATFDRDRVRQLASILLDNAVKYTPEGGNVAVRVEEKDSRAALEVSDNGIGMAEDQMPLVFERFHRADPSRTEGGARALDSPPDRRVARRGGPGQKPARRRLDVHDPDPPRRNARVG